METCRRKKNQHCSGTCLAKNIDTYAENEGLKTFESRRDEQLKKYLRSRDSVLDYGCGTGTIAIKCIGTVKEVQGIDYAPGMIEAAAERTLGNAGFCRATLFDEKLKKESFAGGLAWGILHLVEDRQLVIKRIHGLLKPGGLLISATECLAEKKSSITALLSFLMKIGIFPCGVKFFTFPGLEGSITRAGFRIVEKELFADNPVSCFSAAGKK